MWAALQRRFNDQNRPGCARELLARGLKVLPIDGQTSSVTWSLGFKETGSCSRTASLSRDFQSLASMVDAEQACYLVVFVGDLHGGSLGTVAIRRLRISSPRPSVSKTLMTPPQSIAMRAGGLAPRRLRE